MIPNDIAGEISSRVEGTSQDHVLPRVLMALTYGEHRVGI